LESEKVVSGSFKRSALLFLRDYYTDPEDKSDSGPDSKLHVLPVVTLSIFQSIANDFFRVD